MLESIHLPDMTRDIQSLVKRSGFLPQVKNRLLHCILPNYILLQAYEFQILFFSLISKSFKIFSLEMLGK